MNETEIEMAAYLAAHRILLSRNTRPGELAYPGVHWSRTMGSIAGIIKDVFASYTPSCDYCRERGASSGSHSFERDRVDSLVELPRRS